MTYFAVWAVYLGGLTIFSPITVGEWPDAEACRAEISRQMPVPPFAILVRNPQPEIACWSKAETETVGWEVSHEAAN